MSGEAADLRALASRIEQITRESMVASIAWEPVRALVDHLVLVARLMEVEKRVPPGTDVGSPIRPPGGGSENIGL